MSAVLVAVAVVLLVATAWLAAVETVLERLPLVRALRLGEEGARGSARLLWVVERRVSTRNVVLVTTITVRTALVAVAVVLAVDLLGVGWLGAVAAALASVVLGEVAPRTWVLRHLEATALRLAPSARVLVAALDGPTRLLVDLGRRLVGSRLDVPGPYAHDEQARDGRAVEDADEVIDDDERAMIAAILALGDTLTREIMVARPDMVTIREDDELGDVIHTVIDHGRSRIPVLRAGDDHERQVVGIVHAKDVLAKLAARPGSGRWRDLVRPATFVPETKRVDELLRELREEAVHQAIVVDEYGVVTGLVTIEDVLEEIVGEIVDEHDDEEDRVVPLPDGGYVVDARLAVDDLDDLLGTQLPDDGWDTVGGLVLGLLGHVPTRGEQATLDGLQFTAERVQGRRVERVRVGRAPDEPTTQGHP